MKNELEIGMKMEIDFEEKYTEIQMMMDTEWEILKLFKKWNQNRLINVETMHVK